MSRILVISDIHANLDALEACIAVMPAYDSVWNLGDLVGYGASPNEVAARARQLGSTFIRGNHDKACSGVSSTEDFNPVAALSAYWTRQKLTQPNLDWLKQLPRGPGLPDPSLGAQIAHGSPLDEDQYLVTIYDAAEPLALAEQPLTFFGHTHIQGAFAKSGPEFAQIVPEYRSTPDAAESWRLRLVTNDDARYLINPGSIGQPRDGDPRAAFCLWDTEDHSVTFYRIPYDIAAAQRRIREAGLPEWLSSRLARGK